MPSLEAEEKRKGNEVGCGPCPGYATVPITAGSLCGHAAAVAAVADLPVLPLCARQWLTRAAAGASDAA